MQKAAANDSFYYPLIWWVFFQVVIWEKVSNLFQSFSYTLWTKAQGDLFCVQPKDETAFCLTHVVILRRYSTQLDPDPCWPHIVPVIIVYMLLINCNTLKLSNR